jgi:hypothetical protein
MKEDDVKYNTAVVVLCSVVDAEKIFSPFSKTFLQYELKLNLFFCDFDYCMKSGWKSEIYLNFPAVICFILFYLNLV